jgi:hypothetical protein
VEVNASPLTWALRVLWLSLPLTVGDLIASALDGRSGALRTAAVVLCWAVWAGGLLASLVAQPPALTALRMLAPLPLAAGVVAALSGDPSALGWVGLAVAAVVLVVSLSADVGADFIDGASYGDERRFGLRPPGALLLGPVPFVWVLASVPLPLGVLLLSVEQWVPGVVLVLLGAATAWWGVRVLHRLSRRCLVFVPAGMTLVDELTLAEPVLFRRTSVTRLGPAPADTTARDLSGAAPGLILQIDVDPAVSLVPAAPRSGTTEASEERSVLIAASRPGALLAHAGQRDLAVQRG